MTEILEEIGKEFEEFKGIHSKELADIKERGAAKADVLEQFEKVNAVLADLDEKIQAAQLAQTRPVIEEEECKSGVRNDETYTKAYKEAFTQYCRGAKSSLNPEQVQVLEHGTKALSSGDNVNGGYLMPVEWASEIIKGVTDISPMRSIASVRNTSLKMVKTPKRTAIPTAYWEGETESATASNATYGSEDLTVHKLRVKTLVSSEALEDNAYNLEQNIIMDATEAFAAAEGTAFVLGDAPNRPEGFTIASAGVSTTAGTGTTLTVDEPNDFFTVWGAINEKYDANGTWVMRKAVLAAMRKLQDGAGNYIWAPGVNGVIAPSFNGSPYVLMPDMAALASASKSVAYGDFRAGYQIIDRVQIEVQRDEFSAGDTDQITFRMRKRVTGAVRLAEAMHILLAGA